VSTNTETISINADVKEAVRSCRETVIGGGETFMERL
jgi:hypothetical protein